MAGDLEYLVGDGGVAGASSGPTSRHLSAAADQRVVDSTRLFSTARVGPADHRPTVAPGTERRLKGDLFIVTAGRRQN